MAPRVRSAYGITRIDNDESRSHAWVVRLQRRNKVWSKSFSDKAYGGKRKARTAAIAYRDKLIHEHPPMLKAQYCSILRKNNSSGVVGVCRIDKGQCEKTGAQRVYWLAIVPGPEGSKTVSFSVRKYGEEKAFRLAVRARKKAIAQMAEFHLNSRSLKALLADFDGEPPKRPGRT